jgi:hypothetical protein
VQQRLAIHGHQRAVRVTRRLSHEGQRFTLGLVTAPMTWSGLVVRGRVELPTFRFSGRVTYRIPVFNRG